MSTEKKENAEEQEITGEEESVAADAPKHAAGLSDLVRKAIFAGFGAVSVTEEGIRKTVSEMKLPREAIGFVANQAEKTRNDINRVLRKEVRRYLNSPSFQTQIVNLLSSVTLEIKAEVRLKPPTVEGESAKPNVKTRIRMKKSKSTDA